MNDVLSIELGNFLNEMPTTKARIYYQVDIGLGSKAIVLKMDKDRSVKRNRYDLDSFTNHLRSVDHTCNVVKQIIEDLVEFYEKHDDEKVVLADGIMARLRPIASKSSISYDDLNFFRHLIETVLEAKEREPFDALIIHEDDVLEDDANKHIFLFKEDTIPVGLETAVGSEYPVKNLML